MKNIFDTEKNKHKPPFSLPESYFDDFQVNLEQRLQGEEKPKNVSQKLPFGLPKNYFELLPQLIAKKIEKLWSPKLWYQQPKIQWSMAFMSVFVALGLSWLYVTFDKVLSPEQELANELKKIPKEELAHYLAYHQPDELMEIAHKEQISIEIPTKQEIPQIPTDTLQLKKAIKVDVEEILNGDLDKEAIEEVLEEELNEEDIEKLINP
ncbi:MAG: hypothetical protein SFU27_11910 [Thermonemataceae bacterium]|nr:hypothetical protein [Thermonemataceae bacterium]